MPGDGALEAGRAAHAARLPELEPGSAGERHVRHHADAGHDEVALELEPALRHHLGHALAVALEALQLLAAVHGHPVLLQHVLEEAPTFSPKSGSKVTSSIITMVQSTPCAAVSDAATSQPM